MKISSTLSAFALLLATSAQAHAQGQVANCSVASFGIAFDSCWNEPVNTGGGNAWDANGATLSAFLQTAEPGGATWAGVEKVDDVGAGGGNGTAFDFTRSATSGTISFTPTLDAGWFAIAFKQGDTNAVYSFNALTTVSSLTYNVTNVFKGDDVSNISLWRGALCGSACVPDPNIQVPEPSSLAMLVAGLLGLGATARRRRRGH